MLFLAARYARIQKSCIPLKNMRNFSTELPYRNFRKLKALPFHINPQDAQKQMSKFLLPIISDDTALYSIFASFFLNKVVRPVRFSAAYFPVWVLNAEIEVDLTYQSVRRRGGIVFKNSCLPGSHLAPLCTTPFWSPSIENLVSLTPDDIPFFEESLLHQYGEEVQCMPYTTSPFALLNRVKDLSWENRRVEESLSFSPSSVQVKIFSASPILLPIYLGKYETELEENRKSSFTVWMPAHKYATPNITAENLSGKISEDRLEALIFTLSKLRTSFSADAEMYTFDADDQTTVSTIGFPGQKRLPDAIKGWIHNLLSSSRNIATLASPLEDDQDLRIRPIELEESERLQMYFKNESDIALAKRILEDITNPDSSTKVIHIGSNKKNDEDMNYSPEQPLRKRLELLEKRKEKLTPLWWSDWVKSQSVAGVMAGRDEEHTSEPTSTS